MPLTLKGKLKSRLDIQWDSPTPVQLQIVSTDNQQAPLYQQELIETAGRIQLELSQLDLEALSDVVDLELVAMLASPDGSQIISEPLIIQKCPYANCGQWGHVREDGYCKHCGRRIRDQSYSHGFRKLEIGSFTVVLWNNQEGRLWKNKEFREDDTAVHSIGRYEDKYHYRDYIELVEEKFDSAAEKRYLRFYELLQQSDLLDKFWKPPFACFQEQEQRTLWIYYPRIKREPKWRSISALSYILSKNVELLTAREIANIGLQLTIIARRIHQMGYAWGGVKLSDIILCREKDKKLAVYLKSKDIGWHGAPSKTLLDACLIPWELFWENTTEQDIGAEQTEIYIIAAIMYFLSAKSSNLLSYNSLSYQYGLPTLKLFRINDTLKEPKYDPVSDHLESVMNPALILNPQERGYKTLQQFQNALERIQKFPQESPAPFLLDTGYALDIGYEKCDDDLSKNQDAIFTTSYTLRKKQWGIFVLCDGISTATVGTGDQASKMIVNTFRKWWKNTSEENRKSVCEYAKFNPQKGYEFIQDMIDESNAKIAQEVNKLADPNALQEALIMGSTVTVGIIYDKALLFGWLGDSPIYRINAFGWERLNYEDNERNTRIVAGMPLDECFIESGDALTRCVGAHFFQEKHLDIHFGHTHLYSGEHILICSDGIPDYIEQEASYSRHENYQMLRIAAVLNQYAQDRLLDAKALSTILISTVNRVGGGYDNLSAIVIHTFIDTINADESYQKLRSLSSPYVAPINPHEAKTLVLPPKIDL